MKLSVIIVHYRTPELLKLCLARVREHLGGVAYEIKVIDNSKRNLGFARGVNEGLKVTTGEYRLILNPDALITAGAVRKMIAYMDAHPDIGLMGPQLKYFNGEHQRSYHRFYTPLTVIARRTWLGSFFKKIVDDFMMADTDPDKIQTPDWVLGAAMLVRASAIETVGLMDERYFLYFEDVDWCKRFWHNGYKVVYFPDAIVYHYYPRESSRWGVFDVLFNHRTRWHIMSAIRYFLKCRNAGSFLSPLSLR